MLDIGDWTVKVNACEEGGKVYAFYRPLFTVSEQNGRIDALMNCTFADYNDFFQYGFEHDILSELEISEDSINGDPDAGLRRCPYVAASDRTHDVYPTFHQIPYSNTGTFYTSPRIRVRYKRGVFNGVTNVYLYYEGGNPSNWNAFKIEFDKTHYSTRCGPQLTRNAGIHVGTSVLYEGDAVQRFTEYSDKRLRAGYGGVKARARLDDPNIVIHSPWAQILY